jgi:hypothetical protein
MRDLYSSGFIVFNWNTEGAGYTTSIGSYDFFALNRTGALPINYFTKNGVISDNEEIAYDYFSSLGNADFAQVLQYTALYQIFRKFGITTEEAAINGSLLPGTKILEVEAHNLLIKLQEIPPDKLSIMVDEYLRLLTQATQIAVQEGQLDPQKEIIIRKSIPKIKQSIEQLYKEINYGTNRWKNIAIPELSRLLASPRTYTPNLNDDDFESWRSSIAETILLDLDLRIYIFSFLNFNVENVKEQYVAALNNNSKTWLNACEMFFPEIVGGRFADNNCFSCLFAIPARSFNFVCSIGDIQAGKDRFEPGDVGHFFFLVRWGLLTPEGVPVYCLS